MQGVVFGINGQQLGAGLLGGAGHQLAGHHQSFFVCQRDAFSRFQRAQGRHESHGADGRRDHTIRQLVRGDFRQAVFTDECSRHGHTTRHQFGP